MTTSNQVYLLIAGLLILTQASPIPRPESKLHFVDYCSHFQYPVQEHTVTTDDGYILKVFRIQAKHTKGFRSGLPAVFLQHGLLDSSDTFIINDEDKSLAFVLANRGYDVWLGNNRGNKHSKNHTKYDVDDKQFWDFTFEEMAIYDLPAQVKYVAGKTGQKITYIGHSQGTAQMHVHLAMNPNDSVVKSNLKKYIGLGPVAFVGNQQSKVMDLLINSGLDKLLVSLNVNEFFPGDTWVTSTAGRFFCAAFSKVCGDIIGSIVSADKELDNYDRYDVLSGHEPAGTSTKNLLYWRQLAISNKFERYDYGEQMNKRIYGQTTPPQLDLGNINIPVYYFAGYQDLLADETDVKALVAALKNSPKKWINFYDAGHCSFMWGRQMPFYGDFFDVLEGRQ